MLYAILCCPDALASLDYAGVVSERYLVISRSSSCTELSATITTVLLTPGTYRRYSPTSLVASQEGPPL